jgi:hypothetical protein
MVRARLAMAAVSVISKHTDRGGTAARRA